MIYSIEGNIGSGKSTFVRMLKQWYEKNKDFCDTKFVFVDEPVDSWTTICDEKGTSILEKFYTDQKTYAFSFQMMAYITRLHILRKAVQDNSPDTIIITERCNYTDKNVFAKMLYDDGMISMIDFQIYMKWFEEFLKDVKIKGYVYISASPKTSFDRVLKRGRKGENIPIEYLEKCNNYHDNWMNNVDNSLFGNVLTLNGNTNFDETDDAYNDWIQYTLKFIHKTKKM